MIAALLLAAGLFHTPAVSSSRIAFVYDNEVWTAPRRGGTAVRITDSPGRKFDPRFSPDGRTIAYSAILSPQNINILTVPATGGTPSRVTWLPSHQILCQWTEDGRLLFYTNSLSFIRLEMQLFTVSPRGEMPVKLPLAYGADGAIDATGEWLAYTPHWPNSLVSNWKRYRGGAAADIYLVHLPTRESRRITTWTGADLRPMWHGRTLYYTSDEGDAQRQNIWAYDTVANTRRQVTHFREYDVRNPSIGGDAIVFQLGPDLHLLDLRSGKSSAVKIEIPKPLRAPAHRDVDASRFITARQLSTDRTSQLLEARGDLWLASTTAKPRNLTSTSGVFEREAALSPDGRAIAYASDASGEYELCVRDVASGVDTQLTRFGGGFRFRPRWSPDSKKLAFSDQRGTIIILDVASQSMETVDRDTWAEPVEMAWSSDSASLVYSLTAPNRLGVLWRYDLATRTKQQLTSDAFYASTPALDRRHLFFTSFRNFATPVTDWLAQRITHRATTVIMAVPLDAITATATPQDIERAAFRLGTATGTIPSLATTDDGNVIYGFTDGNGAQSVRSYDLTAKKEQTLLEGTNDLAKVNEPKIDTSGMTVRIDLRAEWRQLFQDAWRFYRDFFFAPKTRGTFDWNDVRRRYAAMLERAETREDVNWILAEMIGEVSVGHAYLGAPGDVEPRPVADPVGMLGADYVLENGVYRFARIHQPVAWDDRVRSPLQGVREGEQLLAVNGKPVDPSKDPRAAFVGLAGKTVTLTIGPSPTRDITVTPVANEHDLRDRDWIERNRAYVERASGGRVGYVRIPDFTTNGFSEFMRQFSGQTAKEALIFDPRWSPGGWIGGILTDALARPALNYAAVRESEHAWPVPRWGAHFGPKAIVTNHLVVSAGENFAYYFRKLKLGPLVGSRTWGGLTGLNDVPALIDGGVINIPNAPFFDDTGWLIEGHGLDPDVVVEDDPAQRGDLDADPQLAAAVRAMVEALGGTPTHGGDGRPPAGRRGRQR